MKLKFEVWARIFSEADVAIDVEEFLGCFDTVEAAKEHADRFKDLSYIYDEETLEMFDPKDYAKIQVDVLTETFKTLDIITLNTIPMKLA